MAAHGIAARACLLGAGLEMSNGASVGTAGARAWTRDMASSRAQGETLARPTVDEGPGGGCDRRG